jgi:hypothetical protein
MPRPNGHVVVRVIDLFQSARVAESADVARRIHAYPRRDGIVIARPDPSSHSRGSITIKP